MARPTGFNANQTGIEFCKERQHLGAAQRLVESNRSIFTNAVYLENILGEINANRGNLHVVAPIPAVITTALWRIRRRGVGAIHTIRFSDKAALSGWGSALPFLVAKRKFLENDRFLGFVIGRRTLICVGHGFAFDG